MAPLTYKLMAFLSNVVVAMQLAGLICPTHVLVVQGDTHRTGNVVGTAVPPLWLMVVVDVGEARVDTRKTTLVSRHAVTEKFPDRRKQHSPVWRSAAE